MKKRSVKGRKKIIVIIFIILLCVCIFSVKGIIYNLNIVYNNKDFINQKKKKEVKKLINVNSLSQEFVDNYFEEVSNLSGEDNDNLLIVISKNEIKDTYGANKVIEAPNNQYYLVYESEEEKNAAFEKLNKSSDIVSVDQNTILTIEEDEFFWNNDVILEDVSGTSNYNSWGVEKLGFDDAINAIETIKQKEPERIKDVVVGLIDTGLNVEQFNKSYNGKLLEAHDIIAPDAEMTDPHGHGTHTAGTIAETTPSNVKIIAIKASDRDRNKEGDENGFYTADLISSINYAISKNVDVISFSIGGQGESYSYYQTIESAKNNNIVFVSSAGNNNTDEYHYPSDYDNTISVAAVDYNLEKAVFSNFGNGITIAAPGFYIKSLSHQSGIRIANGTSMATPHISGAVAMLKSFNKNINLEDAILLLKKHAIDIGDNGWEQRYGHGVVNFNDVSFCSKDVVCDEYGVFEKNSLNGLSTIKIEAADKFVTEYNYGSNTNIVNAKINLYYNNNDYYTKTLSQLIEKIEIINYEPNSYTEQVVTIKYGDLETLLFVDNTKLVDGWQYSAIDGDQIELSNINYNVIDFNNNLYTVTDYPQVIYIPNEINGKKVVSLNDDSFKQLASAYKTQLRMVYIPSGVSEIGKNAFMLDTSSYAKDTGPLELSLPDTVEFIDSTAFTNRDKILFYVVKDSYAYNYAVNNNIDYLYLDEINIEMLKYDIKAFDKINVEDLLINVVYSGTKDAVSEIIDKYEIKYNNGNDSFRAGDTSFTISFDTSYGHHVEKEYVLEKTVLPKEIKKPIVIDKQYIYNGEEQQIELDGFDEIVMSISNNYRTNAGEQEVIVSIKDSNYIWEDSTSNELKLKFKINKAVPEYVLPNGLQAKINQKLSDIVLPHNFEWIDENQTILEAGDKYFKAKYIPEDIDNYEIVDNIDVSVKVLKNILIPNIMIKDKIYDDSPSVNLDDIIISNLDNIEYSIENVALTSSDVGSNIAKVKLKLSDAVFINYEFENGLQEQIFDVEVNVIPLKIEKVVSSNKKYVYNGEEQRFEVNGFDEKTMIIVNNYRTNVGEQEVIVKLKNSNYIWEDGTNNVLKFTFKIEKAVLDVEYESLDNDVIFDGNSHGIILNISDSKNIKVKYMDREGNYTLDEMPTYINVGTYVIKYKLYIDDNYTEIFNEQTLKINKFVITNTSSDYETIYDGKEHSIYIGLDIADYDIKYSINNTDYDLDENPTFTNVGEYTVNYKVTRDNCEDLIGSNKVKIYGIKEFRDIILRDNIFVIKNNSFKSIKNKISVYSKSVIYSHLDRNRLEVKSDISKTGDIISININNLKTFEYYLSIVGDVNSDGKISSADYIKIKKHIMETEIIKNKIYMYSADVNNDNKISSSDYIKIKKYIMNGEKF